MKRQHLRLVGLGAIVLVLSALGTGCVWYPEPAGYAYDYGPPRYYAPNYYAPRYYAPAPYVPFSFNLDLGYYHGGHGGWGHRGGHHGGWGGHHGGHRGGHH